MLFRVKNFSTSILLVILIVIPRVVLSQSNGDYRSAGTGNWATVGTWQRYNAGAWGAPGANGYPGQNAGTGVVTVRNGHTVTLNVSPANVLGSLIVGGGTSGTVTSGAGGPFTLSLTNGLTINNGGILRYNSANGVIDIQNNGSVTINSGGTFNGTASEELNFVGDGTFTNDGTVAIDLLDLEGANSSVTISGSSTTSVGDFNINNSGITATLNSTLNETAATFSILGTPDFTLIGTGTMNLTFGGADFNVQSDNVSVGITMTIPDDLAVYDGSNIDFTLLNGANISVSDDIRIGPGAVDANNLTFNVNSGATITVNSEMRVKESANQVNDFTFNNSGTVTINGAINFVNATAPDRATFTNSGIFTLGGGITGSIAPANADTFNNNSGGTLNIGADIDNDVIMDFDATGNTVNYNSNNNQTIENPTNSRYYNLTLSNPSGNPTKTLSATTDIDGSVAIQNSSIFSAVNGGNNYSLTVGGNWTNSSTNNDPFTQGTGTVTFDGNGGTASQTITNTGDADGTVFNNVTINNSYATSPQITVDNNVVVGGTLTMTQGNINLNSNLQLGTAVGSPGTLGYNTTNRPYIYGSAAFTRYFANSTISVASHPNLAAFFPMGSSLSNRPFYVYPTAISAGGTVSLVHNNSTVTNVLSPTVPDTGGPIVLQHQANWVVTSNGINGTYTLYAGGLTGANGLGTIGSVNDLRLMRSNNVTGTAGTNTTTYAVFNLAQRTAVSQGNLTSTFYIGSVNATNTPLPIDLLSFNASIKANEVLLAWSTSTETNNNHFTIERTKDGLVFEVVDQVPGAGNSEERNDYELIDSNPFQGKSYYRLSQTDYDGTTKYFPLVSVDVVASGFDFKLYPNPTKGEFDVELAYASDEVETSLSVSDFQGREIFSLPSLTSDNKVKTTIHIVPPVELSPGIYVVRLKHGSQQFVRKLAVE